MTSGGLARSLLGGLAYFLIVFAAGFGFGVLRVLAVAPLVGPTPAVLAELPLMLGLSWLASRRLTPRGASLPERAVMGAAALALLLLAELTAGWALTGTPPGETARGWLGLPGGIGLAGQVVFGLMPLVRSREKP